MKKRFLVILFAIIGIISLMVGLTACNSDSDDVGGTDSDVKNSDSIINKIETICGNIVVWFEDGTSKTFKSESSDLGHSWDIDNGVIEIKPTCSTPGVISYKCKNCDASKSEILNSNGEHVWNSYSFDNDFHWRNCRLCDASENKEHSLGTISKDNEVDELIKCDCGFNKTVGEYYSFKVSFECSKGVSIIIYDTQDYSSNLGKNSLVAYSRNSKNGELLNNGEGQVNFEIVPEFGYKFKNVSVSPKTGYKNLKGYEDTGNDNIYRITKITSDLTVSVEVEENTLDSTIVEFSRTSGFYNDEFLLSLSTDPGCSIYYTLDGSNPTDKSFCYTDAISIKDNSSDPNVFSVIDDISTVPGQYFPSTPVDKCNVIKAVAVDGNGAVSAVSTGVYFVGYQNKAGYENIKIVSLSLDSSSLFDYEKGIYVTGKVYDEQGNGEKQYYTTANYTQKGSEWERQATMTVFDNFDLSFQQEIGVRIHGGWSRAFNQKSFNLYAREEYSGSNSFEESFFGLDSLKTCMLRSGGFRDTYLTKIRDILNQEITGDMGFETQKSVPCILFINGEYWGVYNLQERFTEYYVKENYNIDKNDIAIICRDELDVGNSKDLEDYSNMVNFFANTDLSIEENYNLAADLLDIQSFIDYVSVETYVANADWLTNNVRLWRSRTVTDIPYQDGKWRFMMYDTDDSANVGDISHLCGANIDSFAHGHWSGHLLSADNTIGIIFTSLLKNEGFRNQFSNSFIEMSNTVFEYEHVHEVLYTLAETYAEPMVNFYSRFVSSDEEYDIDYFYNQVAIIDEFFKERGAYICAYMEQHINSYAD